MYIFDEIYEKKLTTEDFIRLIKTRMEKWKIEDIQFFCDPAEPQFIDKFLAEGLSAHPAVNAIMPGITKVTSYLDVREDGKPRLYVHPRCEKLAYEFEMYRYPEEDVDKEIKEKPLKLFDHAMDALRYALISLDSESAFFLQGGEDLIF